MMGWIVYYKEDAKKNNMFVQMMQDAFKAEHISLELKILDEEWTQKEVISFVNESYEFEHPKFVLNRSRNAEVSEWLESKGVRVFNSAIVTDIANDKAKTYEFLKGVVPFLPVRCEGKEIYSEIKGNDFAYPYVLKSCSGHGGSQVFMITSDGELKEAINKLNGDKYLIQQCCSDLGKDVRVYILNNEIVAAVLRTSTDSFKSNYSLGGDVKLYKLNDEEKNMVKSILEKLSLDYAGIDFTFHNGKAVFNEIEDAVGARMLYQVSDIDIINEFVLEITKVLGVVVNEKEL